jgi:hypothetical protein
MIFKDLEIAFLGFIISRRKSMQNLHQAIIMKKSQIPNLSLSNIDYKHA